jgi:hypothetical protein
MAGILFSTVVLVLALSVLTPVIGMKNKSMPITTNTYGYGYGYGYYSTSHSPGFWETFHKNSQSFTIHTVLLPLFTLLHR